MSFPLWIALGAAGLVILAHVALFWFFLAKPGPKDDAGRPDDPET